MNIQKTSSIVATNLNCLIYGKSGVGKTTLAGTLEGKTVIVSVEAGLLSLRGKEVDYIEVKGVDGVEKTINFRKTMMEVLNSDYENIFIDSLTEISHNFYEYAQKEHPDDNMTLKRYGLVKEMTVKLIKFLRDSNKNIFITALEKEDKDDMSRRFVAPSLIGSAASMVAAYMDFVFNMQVFQKEDNDVRALLTRAKNGVVAKDRSGKLDEYELPDLQKVITKVYGV